MRDDNEKRCPFCIGHEFLVARRTARVRTLQVSNGNVRRRGKPSTWLPRQKLAEERIPRGTTTIENFLLTKIHKFSKKFENVRPHFR